jgi:23S rRNA (guanine2535-N1)-methyltransferase
MPYRFSRQRLDYSDFASGRVFRSVPGRTAFPVRLADELFQRCLAIRARAGRTVPVTLYDPCCGGATLLCTLAFLHWPSIREIVASDADPEAVALADRNLALLTETGMAERRREIGALAAQFGKASHAEALVSADRLAASLDEHVQAHPLSTRLFVADALDPAELRPHLAPRSIDVVVADIPHGRRTRWLQPAADQDDGDATEGATQAPSGDVTIWRLLEALRPSLAPDAVLAIVGDKSQRARHERYAPAGTLQVGKRRATFLTVRPTPAITLVPFTDGERDAFTVAQVEDYAAWLVDRGDAAGLDAARERARSEIGPELAAALGSGDLMWSAHDTGGATVGWLWVKTTSSGLPPGAAFLEQILVRPDARRRGHGLAMLAALEETLARRGASELRLNVWDTNLPGLRLYERAGYELLERLPAKRQLGKRLLPPAPAAR